MEGNGEAEMEVVMGPGFLGALSLCDSKRSRPGPEDPSM